MNILLNQGFYTSRLSTHFVIRVISILIVAIEASWEVHQAFQNLLLFPVLLLNPSIHSMTNRFSCINILLLNSTQNNCLKTIILYFSQGPIVLFHPAFPIPTENFPMTFSAHKIIKHNKTKLWVIFKSKPKYCKLWTPIPKYHPASKFNYIPSHN